MGVDIANGISELASRLSLSSLWSAYLDYLVFYTPNSWVARIASIFRILSFLVILPLAILGCLDIASYVVARTLGVVDDSKASTSDNATIHTTDRSSRAPEEVPSIVVSNESPVAASGPLLHTSHSSSEKLASSDHYFAAAEDIGLSGAEIFSPAGSRPSSPTISRRQLKDDFQFGSGASSMSSISMFTTSPTLSRSPSPTLSRKPLREDDISASLPAGGSSSSIDSNMRRRKGGAS